MTPKNTLISLGAGLSQVELIRTAHDLDFEVIAIDINEDAPGFKYADKRIVKSTHSPKEIINELNKIISENEDICLLGILNRSSGPPVISAAEISEHFDLPGVSVDVARNVVNKDRLRTVGHKLGIPFPAFKIIDTNNTNFETKGIHFPVVVKPALSMVGKSGVCVSRSESNLLPSILNASKFTINKKIIIENFIKGKDHSFIGFVNNGELYKICILDEFNKEDFDGNIYGRGFKTHTPSKNFNSEKEIEKLSKKIVDTLQIKRSPFMASFRSDENNNLYLIEIHLDIGGDLLIEKLYPSALNFDFKKVAVMMAAGKITLPKRIEVKPTAVIFDIGSELVTEKKSIVLNAISQTELDRVIYEKY